MDLSQRHNIKQLLQPLRGASPMLGVYPRPLPPAGLCTQGGARRPKKQGHNSPSWISEPQGTGSVTATKPALATDHAKAARAAGVPRGANPPALPFPRLPLCMSSLCQLPQGSGRTQCDAGDEGDTFIDSVSVCAQGPCGDPGEPGEKGRRGYAVSGGAGGDAGLGGLALGRLSVPLGLHWGPLGTLPQSQSGTPGEGRLYSQVWEL